VAASQTEVANRRRVVCQSETLENANIHAVFMHIAEKMVG
jgi:hypothetical protein